MSIATAGGTGAAFSLESPIETQADATGEVFTGRSVLFALRPNAPGWLNDVLARVDSLEQLQANWDSYGACEISGASVAVAKHVIRDLAMLDTVEAPIVTAAPSGNVVFSWDDGDRSLDLEIRSDGRLEYVYENQSHDITDQAGESQDLNMIAFLLTQF